MDWIEEAIKEYDERVYGGTMDAHSKSVLRAMKMKEHEFWEREQADFIRGFDDGEPQTVTDYNHGQE